MINTYNLYIHYDAGERMTRKFENISRIAVERYMSYYSENYSNVNATCIPNVDNWSDQKSLRYSQGSA
jgi:hypothetical protein